MSRLNTSNESPEIEMLPAVVSPFAANSPCLLSQKRGSTASRDVYRTHGKVLSQKRGSTVAKVLSPNGFGFSVVKRIHDNSPIMPAEFDHHIAVTQLRKTHSDSGAGIVRLGTVERRPDHWQGVMGHCDLTLAQAFPYIQRLMQYRDPASAKLVQKILFAVFSSMVRMLDSFESAGIVHRDLNPNNIGLSPEADSRFDGALCAFDFGITKRVGELSHAVEGTPGFMPGEAYFTGKVACAQDTYACGVIMRRLMLGEEAVIRFPDQLSVNLFMVDAEAKYDDDLRRLEASAPLSDNQDSLTLKVLRSTEFDDIMNLIVDGMCNTFAEHRPSLMLLKVAAAKLESLLPTQAETPQSVAGFFRMVKVNIEKSRDVQRSALVIPPRLVGIEAEFVESVCDDDELIPMNP